MGMDIDPILRVRNELAVRTTTAQIDDANLELADQLAQQDRVTARERNLERQIDEDNAWVMDNRDNINKLGAFFGVDGTKKKMDRKTRDLEINGARQELTIKEGLTVDAEIDRVMGELNNVRADFGETQQALEQDMQDQADAERRGFDDSL